MFNEKNQKDFINMFEETFSYLVQQETDLEKHLREERTIALLTSEEEHQAVSISLKELQLTKDYIAYIIDHQTSEFNRIYASYPLLFSTKFTDIYTETLEKLTNIISDSEEFILGNFQNIAINSNVRVTPEWQEKRQLILLKILAFYKNKP